MSWIPGLWMGVFWAGLGLFILVSSWLGRAAFYIPKLNINLGWVIIALGLFRIWWWWKTEEEPKRRRLETRAEIRQMEIEIERSKRQEEWEAAQQTDTSTETDSTEEPTPASDPEKSTPSDPSS